MSGPNSVVLNSGVLNTIVLNAFVRKSDNSDALKALIRSTGATLSRKGRSRNWLLQANNEQILLIIRLIHEVGEDSWVWLTKRLNDTRAQLSHDELLVMARRKPTITVTELISLTDCSLAEARKVLDQIEWE